MPFGGFEQRLSPVVCDPQYLNVIEMRVLASTEWLNDVRNGDGEDTIFGSVLEYLSYSDENEDKKSSLKQSRFVNERGKSYTLEEGLLYHKPSGGRICIPKFFDNGRDSRSTHWYSGYWT